MPDTITISGDGVDITGAVLPNATFRIDRVSGQTVASGGAFSVAATFVAVTDSSGAIGRMDNGSFVATFDLVTGHSYRVTPQAALGDLRPFFLSIPKSASSGTINDFLVEQPVPSVAQALQAVQEAQAWAIGTEPDGPGTKSAREYAESIPSLSGWSPILAVVSDGERRVLRIDDWTGGEGDKPATGDYIGASGLVSDIAQAMDIRGAIGDDGDDGWSPVLAVVSDDDRRVLQVSDWVGGEGTKPATGDYVGASGLTSTIGDAVDIRGPAGVGTGDLLAANNLSDLDDAETARSNLSLVSYTPQSLDAGQQAQARTNIRADLFVPGTISINELDNGELEITPAMGRYITLEDHGSDDFVIEGFGDACPVGWVFTLVIPRTIGDTGGSTNDLGNYVHFIHSTSGAGLDHEKIKTMDGTTAYRGYRAYPNATDAFGNAAALHEELTYQHLGNGRWVLREIPASATGSNDNGFWERNAVGLALSAAFRTLTQNGSNDYRMTNFWTYPVRFLAGSKPKISFQLPMVNEGSFSNVSGDYGGRASVRTAGAGGFTTNNASTQLTCFFEDGSISASSEVTDCHTTAQGRWKPSV